MAYFLLNKTIVKEQFDYLSRYVDSIAYNVKANPIVAGILEAERKNSLFAVSSLGGLKHVKDLSRVLFVVQGETKNQLNHVYKKGVRVFVVDNEPDLNKIRNFKDVLLFLRVKFREHSLYTGKYFVYGFSWRKANELIDELKNEFELGIHFHRKTQNVGEWNLIEDFSDGIEKNMLKYISWVNIGGGIPVRYANSNPDVGSILREINQFKIFLNEKNIKLMAEPGRFIAAPAVRLIAKVINAYDNNLILDCSIFNAYMDTYLMHMRLPVLSENMGKNLKPYLLKGCSPDSLDIFRYRVFLEEKKIGDEIIFENAGAYNFYADFNDLPRLKTKIVEDW